MLFEEAGELERHGQWAQAQDRLRQALKLRETPQLHYALGWALENEDKLIEAKAEYDVTVRTGQNRSGAEEATRLAKERLAELEKKMPIIKVHVTGGARGTARVVVDGKEIKREGGDEATTPVNPGSHVIRVERTGTEESIEQMAYVGRGTVRTVDVDTGDVVATQNTTQERHAAPPLRMTEATASDKSGDGLLPWVLVGTGAAAIAGGVILLAASASDASDRDEWQSRWCQETQCKGTTATLPENASSAAERRKSQEAADAGNTKQTIGIAVGAAGLVAAGVGAYFFIKKNEQTQTTGARASSRPSFTPTLSPLPGGGYAAASLTF